MRGDPKGWSLGAANLTVLYTNLDFTTFTEVSENLQKVESYIIIRMRADPNRPSLGAANLIVL